MGVKAGSSTAAMRMARLEGFEPPTFSFEGCRSIHLSYRRVIEFTPSFRWREVAGQQYN